MLPEKIKAEGSEKRNVRREKERENLVLEWLLKRGRMIEFWEPLYFHMFSDFYSVDLLFRLEPIKVTHDRV